MVWKQKRTSTGGARKNLKADGPKRVAPESSGRSPENQQQQPSKEEKAKLRRAQVRRAQIQHRQRKAEYVKQLELDVSYYRELISLTEVGNEKLKHENDTIKQLLISIGAMSSMSATVTGPPTQIPRQTTASFQAPSPFGAGDNGLTNPALSLNTSPSAFGQVDNTFSPQNEAHTPELFGDINVDDLTVTLRDDPTLGTPVFHISSSSGYSSQSSPAAASDSEIKLTRAQEHQVVNFILALEHVCWNHFFLGDFLGHEHQCDVSMGHHMMASTMCMAQAPEYVYMDRKVTGKGMPDNLNPPKGKVINFDWPATGISLDEVRSLAGTLNPSYTELTPVQAWFELANRYGVARMLDERVLEALKQEFNGVVKCVNFGAAMEREAFESVVSRVLGPA